MSNHKAAIAAFAGAACLIGSVVVGVTLMQSTGGTASSAALGNNPQLLTLAELLKLGSAAAAFPVVGAVASRLSGLTPKSTYAIARIGYLGALVLIGSAILGLLTLYTTLLDPTRGALIANAVGLSAAAATGLWAALSGVFGWRGGLPKWLCVVGVVLGVVSLAAVFLPPVGMLMALFGLIWLIGLGLLFLKRA